MNLNGFIILFGGLIILTCPIWVYFLNKIKKYLGYYLLSLMIAYFVIGYIIEVYY